MAKHKVSVARCLIRAFISAQASEGLRPKEIVDCVNGSGWRAKPLSAASVSDRLRRMKRARCVVKADDGAYYPIGVFASAILDARSRTLSAYDAAEDRAEGVYRRREAMADYM